MSWDQTVEAFRANLPGYEERASQTDLAHAMEDALEQDRPFLGQAPPGVGKSYTAIITLLDKSVATGAPCVVATATKALQDQYIADAETIQRYVAPDLRFMVLKGRSNYLCRSKMASADEVKLRLPESVDALTARATPQDVLGDTDRLGIELTGVQRRSLTSTSNECPGKKNCSFGATCFAEAAKEKAKRSHVVIVNHALLAIDALLKTRDINLLPHYPALVVDEAHELRGYVESALSTEITLRGLDQLTSDVVNFASLSPADAGELIETGRVASAALFAKFDGVLSGQTQVSLLPQILVECQEELIAVVDHVFALDGAVAVVDVGAGGDEQANRKNTLRTRCANMVERLQRVIMDDFSDTVRWLERDVLTEVDIEMGKKSRGVLIRTAPLDVAPFLAGALWADTTPLLISATLAIGDDFTYMAHQMGLDLLESTPLTFDCRTPFDFATQAVTYIPEHGPNTRRDIESFRAWFNIENYELIKAAGGRSMLLFTSWDALRSSYEVLASKIRSLGYTVFKQGDMSSTRALAAAFAADEHSVLFGTASFFTGVNVVGDSLRYLGIQKLPFHYPDALWQARCNAIDATCTDRTKWTQGSLPTLQVPDMIFTLLQGYGRLIRTREDRGLVAVFDSALSLSAGTRYGKIKVRPALPPAPVVSDLRSAVNALLALDTDTVGVA